MKERIRQAVAAFAADASHEHLYGVLECLKEAVEEEEILHMAVDPATALPLEEERPDGTLARLVYTDAAEAREAGREVAEVRAGEYFREAAAASDPRFSGVVIDPEGTRMFLPQAMIRLLLLEERPQENEVYFEIGDITELECDCIVNAANSALLRGGGVCGAIFRAAGPELDEACAAIGGCPTGEARITKGFRLKAPYIIHTVGPIYSGRASDRENLAACYRNSLDLAKEHGIHSIAFPAISTGIYGYPLAEACETALVAVSLWLSEHTDYGMAVIFSCFDQRTYDAYEAAALKLEGKA
ncbi:MAG: macro domain-containing protein [Lachnospiraceae bacterium]|nr:macro domain-containing protein [Lachnospiraceae bacterium]